MTLNSHRLLIVDDEESVRDYLAKVAWRLGFDVATAGDRDSVVRKLTEFDPTAILLDLQMPDCDGIQILKILKDLKSEAKVILVSGMDKRTLATATTIGEVLGLKMCGVLQKPVLIDPLRKKLNGLKDTRSEIDPDTLQKAIDNGEIRPVYQPKMMKNAYGHWEISEAEALARWHRDDYVVVLPSEFIEIAERSGLMQSLTDNLLRQVVLQLRSWQSRNIHIRAAFNVSPSLLTDETFPDQLEKLMQEHKLDNSQLILELTESAAMQNAGLAMNILSRLRIKGFGLSIDDFGTGYSSLEQLYRMPFNELKIDRFLVREMEAHSEAATIIEAVISLGHKLNLSVCAEGVESGAVLTQLLEAGCDKFQGYVVGRPASAEGLVERVRSVAAEGCPGTKNEVLTRLPGVRRSMISGAPLSSPVLQAKM